MHQRFSARIESELKTLQKRLESSHVAIARSTVDRQIGRLLERNRHAAQRFDIDLSEDPESPSGLRLAWSVRSQWDEWAQASEGCYVLRTNVTDWTPEQLWQTYIQLPQAEAAFRIQKSDLALRPIWHQKAERVQAHPRLLPRLRPVENPRTVGPPCRTGPQPADLARRARPAAKRRYRATHRQNAEIEAASYGFAALSGPIRPKPNCSTASDCAYPRDFESHLPEPKCSADFAPFLKLST